MFLANLVRLLLLVGVLYESGVDAAEHQREQPSDLRGTMLSLTEKFIEYSNMHDTDALLTFFHPDFQVLLDGLPPVTGEDEFRVLLKLMPERASRIKFNLREVHPMDHDATYVDVVLHFDYVDESGNTYMSGNQLTIVKKTTDGYKCYIMMVNRHNQPA